MKNTHFPIVVAFLLFANVFAQGIYNSKSCTPLFLGESDFKSTQRIDKKLQTPLLIEEAIPLKFHIVRNGAAAFDDTTHVADLVVLMNETFLDANIQFEKCSGINFIDNSPLADGYDPTTIKNQLHDIHSLPNVINVYVANSTISFGGFSFAGPLNASEHYIQDNAIVMNATQYLDYDTFLLAHELGHYFGLFHPSVTTFGLELVDGSNCEIAGDFCCDTPAARPGLCCRFNCDFLASPEVTYDSQGDSISPDIKNIMSTMAFTLSCREYFTPDQYERMSYYHQNFLLDMSCSAGLSVSEFNTPTIQFELFQDEKLKQIKLVLQESNTEWGFQIYDITGALVYEKSKLHLNQFLIDTSTMRSGLYVLLFQQDKKHQQIKFFID